MEEWKPIDGYEGIYAISNQGRVRSLTRRITQLNRWGDEIVRKYPGRVLRLHEDKSSGYVSIVLYKAREPDKCFYVHTLVCEYFNEPQPSSEYEVNHKNGKRSDNVWTNLEWVTHARNLEHARETGLNQGNGRHLSTIEEDEIRAACASGESQASVANRYGYGQPMVSYLVNKK